MDAAVAGSSRHSWTHLRVRMLPRLIDWVLWIYEQRHTWIHSSFSRLWLSRTTMGCREQNPWVTRVIRPQKILQWVLLEPFCPSRILDFDERGRL